MLEGSVRKTGAWLHINAQLIDARTDSHIWAEEYDRDLKDMFAVQSEIAQKVAEQLHAKISPAEKLAIERPPTADLTAFDLYSRAKSLVLRWSFSTTDRSNLLQAADLLNQAVAHDPTFFQAYCQLAWVHDQLYLFRFDRTPERLAMAEAAIEAAFRLRPEAGEAHLARARIFIADTSIMTALWLSWKLLGKTLPNDARLFELKGYIERRRPVAIKKRHYAILSAQSSSTRATFCCYNRPRLPIDFLRRYAEKKPSWIARWRSSQMMSRRKPCARWWNSTGKPIRGPCIN